MCTTISFDSLDECIHWIKQFDYKNIALQFTTDLHCHASEVIRYLRDKTDISNDYFVIVSATCSIDYISPLHLGNGYVNAIIRFGNVCFAEVPDHINNVPVFYASLCSFDDIFTDVKSCIGLIPNLSDTLVLYDFSYACLIVDLLRDGTLNPCLVGKLLLFSNMWTFPKKLQDLVCQQAGETELGQFHLPKPVDEFSQVLYLTKKASMFYRINSCSLLIELNPETGHTREIKPALELRKRIAQIEKIKQKNCSKVGIIYTNSYPSIDKQLPFQQELCRQKGKEAIFISLVQFTDNCKLGNFGDIEAFTIVKNCFCSTLLDSIELHLPLVTLVEFEIALGVKHSYGGVAWNENNDCEDESSNQNDSNKQLIEIDVFKMHNWYGLEIQPSLNKPSVLQAGQSGTASKYFHEPT